MKKVFHQKKEPLFRLPFSKRLSTHFIFSFIGMTVLMIVIVCIFLYEIFLISAEQVRMSLADEVGNTLSSRIYPINLRYITTMKEDTMPDTTSQEDLDANELFNLEAQVYGKYFLDSFSSTAKRQLNSGFTSSVRLFCCPKENPDHTYLGLYEGREDGDLSMKGYGFHQKGVLDEQIQQILSELENSPRRNCSASDFIEKKKKTDTSAPSSIYEDDSTVINFINSPEYTIQKKNMHIRSDSLFSSTLFCAIKLEDSLEDKVTDYFYFSLPEGLDAETMAFYEEESPLNYYMLIEIPINTKTQILYILFIICGVLICFMLLLIAFLHRKVLSPLETITAHMNSYMEKKENAFVPLKEQPLKDELSLVNNSLLKMEHDIQDYIENLAQTTKSKNVMREEFDVARQIQQNLFPCHFPAFPERKDFDIFVKQSAKNRCGGDFYNFSLLDSDHLLIYAGTTSGSGIPTSMFSAITFTLLQSLASRTASPKQILANANNTLSENNNASLSVDVFLGIIELGSGVMTYATAGNPHLYIKHSGCDFEPLPSQNCFPLANIEQVYYTNSTLSFSQSDLLFLHTRGASEAVNPKGMQFGNDYVLTSLKHLVSKNFHLSDIGEALERQICEFTEESPQMLDRTMLLFRYLGK